MRASRHLGPSLPSPQGGSLDSVVLTKDDFYFGVTGGVMTGSLDKIRLLINAYSGKARGHGRGVM